MMTFADPTTCSLFYGEGAQSFHTRPAGGQLEPFFYNWSFCHHHRIGIGNPTPPPQPPFSNLIEGSFYHRLNM